MLKKDVIEHFLARKLDSHDWIKTVSDTELDEAISDLNVPLSLRLKPRRHQKASYYICVNTNNFMLHLDMGLGKTAISLMVFDFLRKEGLAKKMLAVVPNVVNIKNWEEQIIEFSNYKVAMLYGTSKERQELLKSEADIFVINYEGLPVLMTTLQQVRRSKKKKRLYDPDLAKDFINMFDMVVLDEIHKAKNAESLTFDLCDKICEKTPYRYGLTGTPLGRDPQDLWSQFYLIDRGETLGKNITLFRQAFFNAKPGHFGGMDYFLDKKKEPILSGFIKNKSVYYADHECDDLPKQMFIIRSVDYSAQALKEIHDLRNKVKDAKIEGAAAENMYNKGRQICSGFLYEKVSEKEKIALRFPGNNKLDELQEIMEDLPTGQKIVIFYYFDESGKMIRERLSKLKIKFTGGGKDTIKDYESFKNDPKSRAFVIQILSGSTGLNLQNAAYCLYYEPTDDPIVYRQSLKRIHRQGQKSDRVYYYFLITKNSVEERVYNFLKEGIEISKAIIEGKVKLKDIL